MAEEGKLGGGLNLGNRNSRDENTVTKNDNKEQAERVDAPNTGNERDTVEAAATRVEPAEVDALSEEMAAQAAVSRAGFTGKQAGERIYSSYPMNNFALGRFRFENGILRLSKQEDIDEFEKLWKHPRLPASDRNLITEINEDRVASIVESRRQATQNFDSSLGREALNRLHQDNPTIGKEDVAHAARPQQDHNVPVTPIEPFDPEGETGLDQGPHIPPEGDAA